MLTKYCRCSSNCGTQIPSAHRSKASPRKLPSISDASIFCMLLSLVLQQKLVPPTTEVWDHTLTKLDRKSVLCFNLDSWTACFPHILLVSYDLSTNMSVIHQ